MINISSEAGGIQLDLSESEAKFLENNPVLRVGNTMDWYPFDYNDDGVAKGLCVDYLKLAASYLGIQLEWVYDKSWTELLKMIEDGELDLLPGAMDIPSRSHYMIFAGPYIQDNIAVITRTDSIEFKDYSSMAGYRIAYPTGWAIAASIQRDYPEIEFIEVKDAIESFRFLQEKKADIVLETTLGAISWLSYLQDDNLKINSSIDSVMKDNQNLYFGIRKDLYPLKKLLNRVIALIPAEQTRRIQDKYAADIELEKDLFISNHSLSLAEIQWLSEHKTIRTVSLDNAAPLSYFNSKGEFLGISSGYIQELEERLGIHFEFQHGISWIEGHEKIRDKEIDVIASIVETPDRKEKMLFTPPYFRSNIFIFGGPNSHYVEELPDLIGHKVIIQRDHALGGWLENDYPGIELIKADSIEDGLEKLQKGVGVVYLDDLLTTNKIIYEKNFKNITIIGDSDYYYDIAIAVRHDWSILRDIIAKTMKQIQAEKPNSIETRWLTEEILVKVDRKETILVLIICILIIIITFIWGVTRERLRKIVQIQATTDSLTGLLNRREMMTVFPKEFEKAQKLGNKLCFMLLDIDHFKEYNDSYGHQEGDQALMTFSKIMKETYKRADDFLFRVGGEEFACLITLREEDDTEAMINLFRLNLEAAALTHKKNKPYRVITLSGGARIIEPDCDAIFRSIYEQADKALYIAKQSGRNKICLFR